MKKKKMNKYFSIGMKRKIRIPGYYYKGIEKELIKKLR